MVFLSASEHQLVIGFQQQLLIINQSSSITKSIQLPDLTEDLKSKKYDQKNLVRDDSPICGIFSSCGTWFASADCYKRLFLWRISSTDQQWSLYQEFRLEKRPVAMQFVDNANDLLVGDKACDVYRFSTQSDAFSTGELLLGHVSLLLDMKLSLDAKYLATCDRDEKIRISQYPLAHQIQSFCLGHKEFVTSCAFIDEQRLVSSSGDGSIACWNFQTGQLLFQRQLETDVQFDFNQNELKEEEKEGKKDRKLIVNRIFSLTNSRVIASVSSPPQMLCYTLTEQSFEFESRLTFESDLIDLSQHADVVWTLTQSGELKSIEMSEGRLQAKGLTCDWNELEAGFRLSEHLKQMQIKSIYDQFFKVPFEANIEMYYENKKKRIKQKELA